jgi:hypothetical protein
MSEPQRLKDKYAGGLEGALLRSARGDVPSARARGRAFVALGVGGALGGIPAATTAASAATAKTAVSVGLFAAVKWGGIGLAVGALTVGGMQAPKLIASRTAPHAVVASSPKPVAPSDRAVVPPAPLEEPVLDPATPLPAAPEPLPVASRAVKAPEPRASAPLEPAAAPLDTRPEPRLAEEVAALDRARRLVANEPTKALRVLDDYEQRFPSGDLAPEALVLRVEAFVRAGERARAESLGLAYLSRHPRSPHAKRIRTILGWPEDAR